MILLSSIIEEFEERFFDKYKTAVLPSHKKALLDMKQCRKESGPHMLARCALMTIVEDIAIYPIPAVIECDLSPERRTS